MRATPFYNLHKVATAYLAAGPAALRRAILAIAHDNGMINRATTVDAMVAHALTTLQNHYKPAQIAEVSAKLATLTDEENLLLCCGTPAEQATVDCGPLVGEMLNCIFGELWWKPLRNLTPAC